MGGNKKALWGNTRLILINYSLQKNILQPPCCLSALHIWMLKLSKH